MSHLKKRIMDQNSSLEELQRVDEESKQDEMGLFDHLSELRTRILISLAAFAVGFAVSFTYSENLFQLLTLPLHKKLVLSVSTPFIQFIPSENKALSLVFLAPAEAFWMHLKLSMISGLVMASPVMFWELWRFVEPGLLQREKKLAVPFVFSATMLFIFGLAFCFIIVLPFAINFLLTYKTMSLQPMLSVGRYADFCLKFIIAFGVIFELPLIIIFLTRLGVVTPDFLSKKRKYAIVLAFVIAAFLTPTPDAFNQTLMAFPIILLYEAGIWGSRLFTPKHKDDK